VTHLPQKNVNCRWDSLNSMHSCRVLFSNWRTLHLSAGHHEVQYICKTHMSSCSSVHHYQPNLSKSPPPRTTCTRARDVARLVATHCNTLQHTATHRNTLQHTATHCNTLQHTATHGNTLQHTATHGNTRQHTATYCNTLQHVRDS